MKWYALRKSADISVRGVKLAERNFPQSNIKMALTMTPTRRGLYLNKVNAGINRSKFIVVLLSTVQRPSRPVSRKYATADVLRPHGKP